MAAAKSQADALVSSTITANGPPYEYSDVYPQDIRFFIPSFHLADRSVFDEKTGHLNNIIENRLHYYAGRE